MENETEEVIEIEEGKEKEVAESLKVALQKEREEKKTLKERIAQLEKDSKEPEAPKPAEPNEPVKESQTPDLATLVKDTVKKETFDADVSRNIVALATNEEEAAKMREFLSSFSGAETDAVKLAKMAKAAVNADSFIGDVGSMAQNAGMLSPKGTGYRPTALTEEIEIGEEQFMHMRALGYKDKESMRNAIKALEEYNSRK